MKPRSSYKVTLFDRLGPDAGIHVKAFGYGMLVFGITFGVCLLRGVPLLVTLIASVTLGVFARYGGMWITERAGATMRYFTSGGSSTPYEESFSHEQSLVMQRDYAGALACYEQRIAATPNEPRVRVAAADLYMTHGENPKRAAELYREVQRIPGIASGHDIYVSNKLADLYLGPLDQPGRALVEFRRLIHRYPDSSASKYARLAIANLKSDVLNPDGKSTP